MFIGRKYHPGLKKYVSIIKEKAPKSSKRYYNWDIVESGVKYDKKST